MARRDDRRARRQPGAPGGEKPGRRARSRPVHLHPRRRQRRLSARVRTPQRGSRQRPGSGVRLRDPGEVRRGRAVRPRQLPRVGPEAAPPRQLHRRDVADPSIRVRSGRRVHDRPAPRRLGGPRAVVYVRREGDARDARSGDRRPLPRRAPFDDFAHEHRRIRGVVGTAGALSVPADERLTPTLTRVETDLAGTVDGVAERLVPAEVHGQIVEAEHLARYHWAAALADGRRVLDAGCGTAYGSAILANAGTEEVVGELYILALASNSALPEPEPSVVLSSAAEIAAVAEGWQQLERERRELARRTIQAEAAADEARRETADFGRELVRVESELARARQAIARHADELDEERAVREKLVGRLEQEHGEVEQLNETIREMQATRVWRFGTSLWRWRDGLLRRRKS